MTLLTRIGQFVAEWFRRTSHVSLSLPAPVQPDGRDRWSGQPTPDKNVPGDFRVEADCCTLCGVPTHFAPDLFGEDDVRCYVKRQPVTDDERARMIEVLDVQDLDCIRYTGGDPVFTRLTRPSTS